MCGNPDNTVGILASVMFLHPELIIVYFILVIW